MRIAIDIRLLASGATTGIPGYTRDLVNELITNHSAHQYTLFYNALRQQKLPDTWTNNAAVTLSQSRLPNRLLNLSFGLFNRPKPKALLGSDIVFSPNLDILPTTKSPRVITFHDLSFIRYPEFFSSKDHLWHRMQHYAESARSAKKIIAVSEFTKTELVNLLQIPAEKITVIYPGINEMFKKIPENDTILTEYRCARNLEYPFILYLGSLEPRKNLPLLINAFNELKTDPRFSEHRLVIAGRAGYRAGEIFKLAGQSPAREHIRFLGAVTDAERPLLYNAARIFAFPSWLEGFGFPPLEAQACGTPVVAANRSSLPEILGSSAILVDPWRPSELVQAIRAIETDGKVRENIQMAGSKNAQRFSWSTAAGQTLNLFESAIH